MTPAARGAELYFDELSGKAYYTTDEEIRDVVLALNETLHREGYLSAESVCEFMHMKFNLFYCGLPFWVHSFRYVDDGKGFIVDDHTIRMQHLLRPNPKIW